MEDVNRARVLRWIELAGGEITRNRLRRYRPAKSQWEPVKNALDELIASGEIQEFRNELEPLERGNGYAATRYRLVSK